MMATMSIIIVFIIFKKKIVAGSLKVKPYWRWGEDDDDDDVGDLVSPF